MKRDQRLVRLSREHTHALLLAQRLTRGLPDASDEEAAAYYSTTIAFWSAGLLPHFRAEGECLLARLIRHVPLDDERVKRLQSDHLQIEGFIASMRDTPDMAERRRWLAEFAEAMRTHVRWEEETLFPSTEEMLEDSELDAVGGELAERLPETPLPFWESGSGGSGDA